MNKDAYYFPHFSNAKTDAKILKVRRVMGIEGYGIYFMLLEVLRDQTDFRYPLSGIEDIAYEWHVSKEKIFAVITNFDLFIIENDEFFSPKFIEFLQPYIDRKDRARIAANKRWRKELPEHTETDANAMQMHSVSIANAMQSKEEESKEEIIKTWKNDFEIYKTECLAAFRILYTNPEFISEQAHLNPGVNIKLTLEKAVKNFWSTEAGWKNKKSAKIKTIDWKATAINAISSPMNKVYLTKQEQEPKPMEVLHIEDPIFNKNKPY